MEVKLYTYEELPEYTDTPEGAVRIPSTGDEIAVMCEPDIPFETAGGYALKMHVLSPVSRNLMNAGLPAALPCVVFVQGSAWFEQNIALDLVQLGKIAAMGYVVASVQYRHSMIAPFPAQIIDAKNGIRFLRANAKRFRIDPDRMIFSGTSSGGHTAVYGGMIHNDDTGDNAYPGVSAAVNGIVDFYGSVSVMDDDSNPTTLNYNLPDSPEGFVMGHKNLREEPGLARLLSVEENITADTVIPPVLIFHGTKDKIVNCTCSVHLYEKLKACGKEAKLYLIEGADHGGAEFFMESVMKITDEFMKHCFTLPAL